MIPLRAVALLFLFTAAGFARPPVSARSIAESLSNITLDPAETFRVRDLHLRRGDVSFYFTDGTLSFATPVEGKRVAAIFTIAGAELGEAELLLLPPQPAERQSLASYAHTPNLDEHFTSAVLYFTDGTADELLTQIGRAEPVKEADIVPQLRYGADRILRNTSSQVRTRMVSAILDPGTVQSEFFYAAIKGRSVGSFDVLYNPNSTEPVTVGRMSESADGSPHFELWANYQPRHFQPYQRPGPVISDYSIDATINPDLSLSAISAFQLTSHAVAGRVIALDLSRRLRVTSATVDGTPVEIYQQVDQASNGFNSDAEFLLVTESALDSSRSHRVEIHYAGSIISQVSESSYLVAERNLWYPHSETMLTAFDLRFHCPERFEIVSSGELLEQGVQNGIRSIHRRTESPEQMAGFNLGEYEEQSLHSAPYRIHAYEDKGTKGAFNGIPSQAAEILRHYTREWLELPDHSLAVTPVPGDFGQGFPGLIYLARTAYLPEADRPTSERGEQSRIFFSNLLLPHEIAHQWWGNLVTADGYRSDWLMEAMANSSALEFIAANGGTAIANSVLEQYRADLSQPFNGKTIESSGPVDFGTRIMTTAGFPAWQAVIYKKGTWILQMLRSRMGNEQFVKMQSELLGAYRGKPLSNEDFRKFASRYIPANQPDRDLELFFETWVYGTGVPKISINRSGTKVNVTEVDDAFTADLPLRCKAGTASDQVRWLRIEAGENSTPVPGCKLPPRLDFLYYSQ